ncbi:hypothetical protein D9M71_342380 [compost metagenome]
MDANEFPAPAPQPDLALLANILALATRNMSSISALVTQLSVELSQSSDPHLQRLGQNTLGDIARLSNDLDSQWVLIESLSRYLPPCQEVQAKSSELITEIHITELPQPD